MVSAGEKNMRSSNARRLTFLFSLATASSLTPAIGRAQDLPRQDYDLPAQPLEDALDAVSIRSGRSIGAAAAVLQGRAAPALKGALSAEEAVATLLAQSGLRYRLEGSAIIIEGPDRMSPAQREEADPLVVVTGSRIRGAPIASPVIRLERDNLVRSGQTSLADVVRNIPQNYSGGLNHGVGFNTGSNNIDTGGASTINLRGLGSDATLTLLNGHRLAYNGSRQGIDVSAIPLGAVERIEIVADGASALYGSDAVAGVANIILRRDYDGLRFDLEGGLATQGGYSRQRYGATTGQRWEGGGFMASFEYARSSLLMSDERDFADSRPGVSILPPLEHHAVVVAGHQDLTSSLHFSADLLYDRRTTHTVQPGNPAGDLSVSRYIQPSVTRSLAIAPALTLDLPGQWHVGLSGVYGDEKLTSRNTYYVGDTPVASAQLCYCNEGQSIELAADGDLFHLPAGAVRVALGTGFRRNLLDGNQGPGNVANVYAVQKSYYGYGELSLPFVSPAMDWAGIHRLSASAALRYEDYPGIGDVLTPKLGLIYAPSRAIDIKASWGRSFRAPTLMQQYQAQTASLAAISAFGGTGYGADAAGLLLSGGNPDVKPEKARSWTLGVDIHPPELAGLRLQISYFNTRYQDRIVTPIALSSQSLRDPVYADFITYDPADAAVSALIAQAATFTNRTGLPVDPAKVVAIVNNRYTNASSQAIEGVDMLADYARPLGGGTLNASLNLSYLHFDQRFLPDQPVLPRSGQLFTPPRWRGRASLGWLDKELSLNASLSYIGSVEDRRTSNVVTVDGMGSLDLTARYTLSRGALAGLELGLSVNNALDDRPTEIASTSYIDSTYDSTNYAPIGRLITLSLGMAW